MKVLVTGATGFVGRALPPVLVRAGHEVRLAVRRSDPGLAAEGDRVVVGDIGPGTDWREALADIEVVVHLAARVHVMHDDAADPLAEYRCVNTEGTQALGRAAVAAGVRRVVYLSTVKVLGDASGRDSWCDNTSPAPSNPYAVSKWEAEQALFALAADRGLEVAVLRPPLVYGPNVKGNFRRLLDLCRRRLPLPLGAIDNRRSLLYVGNLADAIMHCLEHPGVVDRSFLVSDGEAVSTPDLVRRLSRALGHEAMLLPVPPSLLRGLARLAGRGVVLDRLSDTLAVDDSGFCEAVGWTRPISLSEGLAFTADWYRDEVRGRRRRANIWTDFLG